MEQVAVFEEKVAVYPADLRADIISFDDILLGKLKAQLEGKCSKHGYVIPKTLTILSRSLGYAEKGRFTSDFLYYIKAQGKVYNPPDGTVVEGEVSRKSKAGLYVIVEGAVHIMIVRDLHIGNEEFDSIAIGDRIRIEIKRSRFQINDPHILSIGQFLGRVGGAAPYGAAPYGAAPYGAAPAGPVELESVIESAAPFADVEDDDVDEDVAEDAASDGSALEAERIANATNAANAANAANAVNATNAANNVNVNDDADAADAADADADVGAADANAVDPYANLPGLEPPRAGRMTTEDSDIQGERDVWD